MHAFRRDAAAAAGLAAPDAAELTPHEDEAPGMTAEGFSEQGTSDSPDFQGDAHAEQASLATEGEEYAQAYLDRLHAGIATPGELAVILAFLSGEMLHGACGLIEKTLGVRRA
jgi:hypothetical protein